MIQISTGSCFLQIINHHPWPQPVMGCHQCWETMWPISWWPEPYGPWPHPMYVMFQSRSCGIYMIHDGGLLWFGIICGIYGIIWYLVWYYVCCKRIWTFDGDIPFWLVIPKKMSKSFLKSKGLHIVFRITSPNSIIEYWWFYRKNVPYMIYH